jgi:gliding motility-associated-like protein
MHKFQLLLFLLFYSVYAHSQTADFTYQTASGLFCSPSVVQFTQSASGSPHAFIWNFGNGTITSGSNPQVTYTIAGTYTVKLVVVYKNNAITVSKTITINPSVTASIITDRRYICAPGDIHFTAFPAGIDYQWDFGDGSGIIPGFGNNIAHTFSAKQDYTVKLKATNAAGCYDTASTMVTLKDPTVTGTVTPPSGCIPATVRFTASANIPSNSSVSQYTWDYGEGGAPVSTVANSSSNVYNNTGGYSPSVMITTTEGCTATFNYPRIAFGTPPTNSVGYPVKPVICGSEIARFVAKATNANSYAWNFGDGTTATVSDTLASHKYRTLGPKTITVTPAFNGCRGASVTFTINVVGVIAGYRFVNICNGKETFSFTNTSQGNLSTVNWNFGDGSSMVNTLNASHTYPTEGSFSSSLLVIDSITGCRDSLSQTIYTALPKLLNPDTSICRNSLTSFSVINSYNNANATFTWNVVGMQKGPFIDSTTITEKATVLGNFNNYVVIDNGAMYCKDTIRLNHSILVRGPQLDFTAPSSLCFDSVYTVTNHSKPYLPQDSIRLWYWNFGIGTVNDTLYQPDPYTFTGPGKFNVKLSAMDINGCFDSLVKPVTIHPLPFVQAIPTLDTLCQGTPDTLIAFYNYSLEWSPAGSLSSATADTVLANPSATTTYYATATTQFGCTSQDSAMLKVFPPFTATSSVTDPYICQNDTITLRISPPGEQIVWSPASGLSNPAGYNPVAQPLQTTTYTATLSDSAGCFSSTANITVHVKNLPQVDAGPDSTYPYNTPFSLHPTYSNNVASVLWTPTDSLSCNTCSFPNGISWATTTYQVTVTSDSGCIARDSVTIFVQCKDSYILMPTAFTPNNDGLNDYYYPLTRGIKKIVRFSIYNRFGQLVYEARNFSPNEKSFGWNGQLKSWDQSSSVFVYIIEAICDVGDTVYKKGSFVLLR